MTNGNIETRLMRRGIVHIYPDAAETCRAAADRVAAIAAEAIGERGRCFIALAGGTTPIPMYRALSESDRRQQVDWNRCEFFWTDERPVPPGDIESNFRMTNEALLRPLAIPEERIHRMKAESFDKDAAAEDYQEELARAFGVQPYGEPPRFDVVLLGVGDDGHTASLFPATPALLETRRWIVANPVRKLESVRLTMTPMLINRARHIIFLATGERKAAVIAEVLEGPIDTQRLPAQIIRPAEGQVEWFLDQSAASRLESK